MRVLRVVDLSVPLDDRTPVYPGDPPVRLTPVATIARDGYNLLAVHMGSQSGTHCDAPVHFLEDGLTLDQLPLERFVGPGVLVDATGLDEREPIGWDRIEPQAGALAPGAIVLLHTGWD